jgi:hypothetical protein
MGDSELPFIGSQISLISKSGIRYEGVLHTIDMQESSIALQSGACGAGRAPGWPGRAGAWLAGWRGTPPDTDHHAAVMPHGCSEVLWHGGTACQWASGAPQQ